MTTKAQLLKLNKTRLIEQLVAADPKAGSEEELKALTNAQLIDHILATEQPQEPELPARTETPLPATAEGLMRHTKEDLVDLLLAARKDAAAERITERDVQIKSPAGPVHHFHGFVDDGEGPIVITGLPEDEIGHWAPFYTLTINGQNLGKSEIEHGD